MTKEEIGPQLFISDASGIYIPQRFAEEVDRSKVSGVGDEEWEILLSGPSNEDYWDVWDEVECFAIIRDKGTSYFLYQDGDLWLIPEGMEWSEKTDFYDWPEEPA
jgi:hypothetical protein